MIVKPTSYNKNDLEFVCDVIDYEQSEQSYRECSFIKIDIISFTPDEIEITDDYINSFIGKEIIINDKSFFHRVYLLRPENWEVRTINTNKTDIIKEQGK